MPRSFKSHLNSIRYLCKFPADHKFVYCFSTVNYSAMLMVMEFQAATTDRYEKSNKDVYSLSPASTVEPTYGCVKHEWSEEI